MCEAPQTSSNLSKIQEDFESIKDKYCHSVDKQSELEKELYKFKSKHKQNRGYIELIKHIENKVSVLENGMRLVDNSTTSELSLAAIIVTILGILNDMVKNSVPICLNITLIVLLIVFAIMVVCPICFSRKKTMEKSFYEICLNILK